MSTHESPEGHEAENPFNPLEPITRRVEPFNAVLNDGRELLTQTYEMGHGLLHGHGGHTPPSPQPTQALPTRLPRLPNIPSPIPPVAVPQVGAPELTWGVSAPPAVQPTRALPTSTAVVPRPIAPSAGGPMGVQPPAPQVPLASRLLGGAGRAYRFATDNVMPWANAAMTANNFAQHSMTGANALSHGDSDTAEDSMGESLLDLAGALPIPIVQPAIGLGRTAFDHFSTSDGGPTLGALAGRSGPRTDVSDLEARDRAQRGDHGAHAITGHDSHRRARNAEHEARVHAAMAQSQAHETAAAAAQQAAYQRQHGHGDAQNGTDFLARASAATTSFTSIHGTPGASSMPLMGSDPGSHLRAPAEFHIDGLPGPNDHYAD